MTMTMTIDETVSRRNAAVAAHEAGHAVVARSLGVMVVRASAKPGAAGVVTRWRRTGVPAEYAATMEKLLLVDLSGQLAEYRATGQFDGNAWRADERNALSRALRLILDENHLRDDELDDGHRATAAALVERLRPKAAALVEENPAKRVAAALADGQILTGSEVDALMAEQKP